MDKKKEQSIEKYMTKLGITREEAEDLYNFDNAKDNEQKDILDSLGIKNEKVEKPKASPINKVKQLKAKQKSDENKESIKEAFMKWLESNEEIINPQEFKNNQYGFFDKDGNFYSFKLTKHKTIQDGYKM